MKNRAKFGKKSEGSDHASVATDLNSSAQEHNGIPIDTIPAEQTNEFDTGILGAHPNSRDLQILALVEPFLDIDIAQQRNALIDSSVVTAFERNIIETLGQPDSPMFITNLCRILAEVRSDIHYLKAAYLDSERRSQPSFVMRKPPLPHHKDAPRSIEIDMRADITGGNWHLPEPEGRWAGPESESSLLFPALKAGTYRIEIDVTNEIAPGIITGTEILVNGELINFTRPSEILPTVLEGQFVVPGSYRLPFWSIKFRFAKLVSPTEYGSADTRRLAIFIRAIRIIWCSE